MEARERRALSRDRGGEHCAILLRRARLDPRLVAARVVPVGLSSLYSVLRAVLQHTHHTTAWLDAAEAAALAVAVVQADELVNELRVNLVDEFVARLGELRAAAGLERLPDADRDRLAKGQRREERPAGRMIETPSRRLARRRRPHGSASGLTIVVLWKQTNGTMGTPVCSARRTSAAPPPQEEDLLAWMGLRGEHAGDAVGDEAVVALHERAPERVPVDGDAAVPQRDLAPHGQPQHDRRGARANEAKRQEPPAVAQQRDADGRGPCGTPAKSLAPSSFVSASRSSTTIRNEK